MSFHFPILLTPPYIKLTPAHKAVSSQTSLLYSSRPILEKILPRFSDPESAPLLDPNTALSRLQKIRIIRHCHSNLQSPQSPDLASPHQHPTSPAKNRHPPRTLRPPHTTHPTRILRCQSRCLKPLRDIVGRWVQGREGSQQS